MSTEGTPARLSCLYAVLITRENGHRPMPHTPPTIYEIRIDGHLDREWSDWFEGLTITPEEDGTTLLS